MYPKKQGLYSPEFEHENCGAGFICSLKGEKTNSIIGKALNILVKLSAILSLVFVPFFIQYGGLLIG